MLKKRNHLSRPPTKSSIERAKQQNASSSRQLLPQGKSWQLLFVATLAIFWFFRTNFTLGVSLREQNVEIQPLRSLDDSSLSYCGKRENGQLLEPGIQTMPVCISRYATYHSNNLCQQQKRGAQIDFVRWTCRFKHECGGLGDRLYGMVMTFFIAMLTNRTMLLKDWQEKGTAPMTDFVQPALVSWNASIEPSTTSEEFVKVTDNRNHPLLLDPCRSSLFHSPFTNLQTNIMTHESLLRNSPCFQTYCGGCQGEQRSLFHMGFWTLFRFTHRLQQQSEQLRQLAGISSRLPYISIHIRTGQGETFDDPLRHNGDAELQKFRQCAIRLQRAMRQKCKLFSAPPVYVAADNNYVKSRLQRWDESGAFKAAHDIEVLHIGKSRFKEFDNVSLAYDRVWGELKILIDSTCIVMSRSKFSYMGSELSPQQPRCAVTFDQCSEENVTTAIESLRTPCTAG